MTASGATIKNDISSTRHKYGWVMHPLAWLFLLLALIPCRVGADEAADMQKLFLMAFSKKKIATPTQFVVDLKIDGELHQSVKVFTNKQQAVDQVKAADLIPQLKSILKKEPFEKFIKALEKKEKVSFEWLASQEIPVVYDSAALSLNIRIKPEHREPLILSLLQDVSLAVRKSNHISPSKVSGYLNLYSNASLAYQNSQTASDLQLRAKGSLTVNKATLESELTRTEDDWQVSNTHITYDEPDKLRRYRLGDINSIAGHFQNSSAMKGLSLRKDFSLDSSQESQPTASEELILTTRSDVIVYLNKFQLQRYTLAAGTYQLKDIGLSDGQNDIELKIIDAFGKETIKKTSKSFDTRLLKPTLSKYAFSVGLLAERNDLWGASARYQYGLSDTLTVGGSGLISNNNYLFASEALQALSVGALKSDFAISGNFSNDVGGALSLAFKPNKPPSKKSIRWEVGAEIYSEKFNASFDDVNFTEGSNADRSNLHIKANKLILEHWQTSLGLNHKSFYNADDSLSMNLSASRHLLKGASLSLGANYNKDDDWNMSAQLSIPLSVNKGRRKRLGMTANTKNNAVETRYEIKALNPIGKDSFSGAAIYRQNEDSKSVTVEGAVRYASFDSHFSASNSHFSSGGQQRLQVGINASLACVEKECALSYPIEDSFALVGGPKNQQQPIALNTGNRRFIYTDDENSLPQQFTALIKGAKSKAVVHLESYHKQRISVDEISLPFGYDPEKTEFQVDPQYHQGFSFNVGGEPGTIVDGVLVDKENKPLGFKGGQWVSVKNKDKAIAFFSNKAGRFRIPSIAPGDYSLNLHDFPNMQDVIVTVKSQEMGVQNVGNLTIYLE